MDKSKYTAAGLIFIILLASVPIYSLAQVQPDKINRSLIKKSVESVLGTEKPVEWKRIVISDSTKKELIDQFKAKSGLPDTLSVGMVTVKGSKRYVVADIAPSRSETFSYLLFINESKEIIGVDVLEYRENYGYEIDYSFFRKQFHGINNAENIIFGRTIQNISGATISARSLTNSIHDLLLILNEIKLP